MPETGRKNSRCLIGVRDRNAAVARRYILERYYGMTVVGMYIVCVHPDVGDEPIVDVVPDLGPQIDAIMAEQRRRRSDVWGLRRACEVSTNKSVAMVVVWSSCDRTKLSCALVTDHTDRRYTATHHMC